MVSLKLPSKLYTQLDFSVPEIQAAPDQLNAALPVGAGPINGSDVIVGVIDFGGDFRHDNFRNPDGTTRLLFLWDQQGGPSSISPPGFGFGREFDQAAINNALQAVNPYLALPYNPGILSHGTHVMDIAAGNGRATGRAGVAPNADLIFVQIQATDVAEDESLGNSARLLEAADYIFTKADELGRQAVVNISLGTQGGPHDGSTLAEQGFDTLLQQPGRAIVISAGNSRQRSIHAQGEVTAQALRTLTWQINPNDPTDNELEVWYDGASELEVTLIVPGGQRLGPIGLGSTVTLTSQGTQVGRIIHRQNDPNNGDNHIDILLDSSLPDGDWGVELVTQNTSPVGFHSWIERDTPRGIPQAPSSFSPADNDRSHTIGSISCGLNTIVVGSYVSGDPAKLISGFSAEGPTRDGKQKPEVSAPFLRGVGILAARSSTQGSTRKPGTSMASPHVAGLTALLMQAAGQFLTIGQIRAAIQGSARKNPPPAGDDWNSLFGFGRVDASAAVLTQIAASGPPCTTSELRSGITDGTQEMSVENLLSTITAAAARSRSRVRIQIEVEPAAPDR